MQGELCLMSMNAHRVFTNNGATGSYLGSLTLVDATETLLRGARDAIREALREGLREWPELIRKGELFEAAFADAEPQPLRPKFRMQGSFSYHTCNTPAWTPPQEVDLDDGVFLPVSFLEEGGDLHPVVISQGYFAAVERILGPLCKREGWTLITDKPSCVRIQVQPDAHVDLALYAVPDREFDTLIELMAQRTEFATAERAIEKVRLRDSVELAEALYRGLRADHIMLAHRDEGWKRSDPRKLEDWFAEAVRTHGPQLRRVCRYLKGWRDHQWEACRLASIALMAAAVTSYKEAKASVPEGRDDLALLMVAERLPEILAGTIANPVVDGARLDEGWSKADREGFVAQAVALRDELRDALQATGDAEAVLTRLTKAFGDRIPDDVSLVSLDGAASLQVPETKSVAAPAVLSAGLLAKMAEEPEVREAVTKVGSNRFG